MPALSQGALSGPYPERDEPRENAFERFLVAAQYVSGARKASRGRLRNIVDAVQRYAQQADALTLAEI